MDVPTINTTALAATQVESARTSTPPQRPTDTGSQRRAAESAGSEESSQNSPRKAADRNTSIAPPTTQALGRVRFEVEEGTRVAKFFDTKDILIYQVPPEGQLYLVKVQEAMAQDQVETSA